MAQVGIYHESTGFVYIYMALGENIGGTGEMETISHGGNTDE